jgi:hypothetical protein
MRTKRRTEKRTKESKHLTLKDRLSRLTYLRACQLLGPEGPKLIRRGASYQDDDRNHDVYLRGDVFRLRLPGAGPGGKDAVATITAMAAARNRLNFLGELVAQDAAPAPAETLVNQLRSRLDECVQEDSSGRQQLTVTLPNRSALDALAQTLARLLAGAGKA